MAPYSHVSQRAETLRQYSIDRTRLGHPERTGGLNFQKGRVSQVRRLDACFQFRLQHTEVIRSYLT